MTEQPTFEDIYRNEHAYVLRLIWRFGVDRPSDCEDIAQEVFVVFFQRGADCPPDVKLRTWLGGIAWRVTLRWKELARNQRELLRSKDSEEDDEHDPTSTDPEQMTATAQVQAHIQVLVRAAIQKLPEERRVVLVMHDLEDAGMPEIARVLDISEDTGWTRLKLARRDFAAIIRRMSERDRQVLGVAGVRALPAGIDPAALLKLGDKGPEVPADTSGRLWRRIQLAIDPMGDDGGRGGGPVGGGSGGPPRNPAEPRFRLPAPRVPSSGSTAAARVARVLLACAAGAGAGGGAVYVYMVQHRQPPEPPVAVETRDTAGASAVSSASLVSSVSSMSSTVLAAGTAPAAVTASSAAASKSSTGVIDAGAEAGAPEAVDPLDTDAALMRRALAALGSGKPEAALALVQRHAQKYPESRRGQEREALSIRTLAALGRRAEAEAIATGFRRLYPDSMFQPSIDAALAPAPSKP